MAPSDPVGIRKIQSLLREATQTNLSSFHKAGLSSSRGVTLQEILDLKRSKDCSMTIFFESGAKDVLRELVYRRFKDYVVDMFLLNEFKNVEYEENWYHIGKEMGVIPEHVIPPSRVRGTTKVMRFYIDYRLLILDRRNLRFLRDEIFCDYEDVYLSPDFAGTIDVYLKGNYEIPGMIDILNKSIGIPGIRGIEREDDRHCVVSGSNLGRVSVLGGVVKDRTISDDVREVATHLGLEAAREMINRLVPDGSLVADMMTWYGKPFPFTKRNPKVAEDPLLSMALEQPRLTIKDSIKNRRKDSNKESLHSQIMLGESPSIGTRDRDFEIIF
ncbi:MAG: hypothetical protein JWR43_2843 [Phenylobacterium sp.]|jgi:hypothetical protein|nr:hypothetical protein [Phenylobacterium sp.]